MPSALHRLCLIIALALGLLSPARAAAPDMPSPDMPTPDAECDAIAALRLPFSSTTAVHDRQAIDWSRGVVACQTAVQAHPDDIHLVYQLARAQDHTGNYIEALRAYKTVVAAGNTEAMVDLGAMYYFGHGVIQNDKTAFEYFTKAAQAGSNRATVNLSAMIGDGRGVPRDNAKSLELAEQAVEQGNPFGLKIIADHYFNGAGVPRNYTMCAQYLQQAADLGDGQSMKFLANMYESGYLGAPDPAKAAELRLRALRIDPDSRDPSPPTCPCSTRSPCPTRKSPPPIPAATSPTTTTPPGRPPPATTAAAPTTCSSAPSAATSAAIRAACGLVESPGRTKLLAKTKS